MQPVFIYATRNSYPLDKIIFNRYLAQTPIAIQQQIKAYRRWEDAQAMLLGRMLLKKALGHFNFPKNVLAQIQYSTQGRPFIEETIDFNLSHSGEFVVCAISKGTRLGIDIELIRPMDLSEYQSAFRVIEWNKIHQNSDPILAFYQSWTIKEAAIKAHGEGLGISLDQVAIHPNKVILEQKAWHYHSINPDDRYACHLVTETAHPEIKLLPIFEPDLLDQLDEASLRNQLQS